MSIMSIARPRSKNNLGTASLWLYFRHSEPLCGLLSLLQSLLAPVFLHCWAALPVYMFPLLGKSYHCCCEVPGDCFAGCTLGTLGTASLSVDCFLCFKAFWRPFFIIVGLHCPCTCSPLVGKRDILLLAAQQQSPHTAVQVSIVHL